MRRLTSHISFHAVPITLLLLTRSAAAQSVDADAGADAAHPTDELTAPVLKSHAEAPYPPNALRERVEGSPGLELLVDEAGKVVDVKVVTPAGHGFDEAAALAARAFSSACRTPPAAVMWLFLMRMASKSPCR